MRSLFRQWASCGTSNPVARFIWMNRRSFAIKNWLLVGSAMLLASCGSPDDPTGSEANAGEAATATVATDIPLDISITQFPKSYFGRWGLSQSDCAMGTTSATGLISVQGSLVKFYGSVATMRDGKRESLTSTSAHFDVVGEGEKWEAHTRYRLSDDRQQLTREDLATGEKYVYDRCQT